MTEKIVFGGGCFWCMEAVFQMLRGVHAVASGYAGGTRPNPTYESVSMGTSGHVEGVEIEYDPNVISVEQLLSVFFSSHNPTTLNRQGNDVGTQYRSAIFYSSEDQKKAIDRYIQNLKKENTFGNSIVTDIKPLDKFYVAEGYHQNYYRSNQDKPYCQFVINPKVAKLREHFAPLLKSEES